MEQSEAVVLSSIDVGLDRERVLDQPPFSKWLESPSGAAIEESVDRLREAVLESVTPRGCFAIRPLAETGIEAADPPQGLLTGSHVGLGVLTLGSRGPPEPLPSKIDPVVWDALENLTLQDARTTLLEHLLATADRAGFNTTRVYAPGTEIGGWPLSRRQFVFDSLPLDRIDLVVRNGRPDPEKTLTFAIGLGQEIEQAEVLLSCGDCGRISTCPYAGGKTLA